MRKYPVIKKWLSYRGMIIGLQLDEKYRAVAKNPDEWKSRSDIHERYTGPKERERISMISLEDFEQQGLKRLLREVPAQDNSANWRSPGWKR